MPRQQHMLLPETDVCMQYLGDVGDLGERQHLDYCGRDDSLDSKVQLAYLARVASAFGALMYEMLISSADIASANGSIYKRFD